MTQMTIGYFSIEKTTSDSTGTCSPSPAGREAALAGSWLWLVSVSAFPLVTPISKGSLIEILGVSTDDKLRYLVMKTALADIYIEFSTILVPEADKQWQSGDEAHKAEVYFERVEW